MGRVSFQIAWLAIEQFAQLEHRAILEHLDRVDVLAKHARDLGPGQPNHPQLDHPLLVRREIEQGVPQRLSFVDADREFFRCQRVIGRVV